MVFFFKDRSSDSDGNICILKQGVTSNFRWTMKKYIVISKKKKVDQIETHITLLIVRNVPFNL